MIFFSDGKTWRCQKRIKGQRHCYEMALKKGSFFESIKLSIKEALLLAYFWAYKYPARIITHEVGFSPSTIIEWQLFFR
jgi:hypothetical protein